VTNAQCQAYAVIAVRNLIRDGIIKANIKKVYRAIDRELYQLFDEIGEEEAEERAARILTGA
jgi:hypothetical protein